MNEIANKAITLSLNANWLPIGHKTVKDAIISLAGSESKPEPNSMAIDIEYELNDEGEPLFDKITSMRPVTWSEWITLPIRSWDLTINGSLKSYRVPTVIIAVGYDKMPVKRPKSPNSEGIFARDGLICQYSGEKLTRSEASLDHVLPKSLGGKDSWNNLVTCKKSINSKKGNKTNKEANLKLIKEPVEPKPTLQMNLIGEARHKDHFHFLIKSK